MKVTSDMTIRDALRINENMLDAFIQMTPEFERLRYPSLRRAIAERITVEQAARVARLPLTEALYLLNIVAGESDEKLNCELQLMRAEDFEYLPAEARPWPAWAPATRAL